MASCFVLVDYENIQPQDVSLLKKGTFKVKLFTGPHQPKVPVEFASTLQQLGANAEYVTLEAAGKNALDFHIAYYIGALSAKEPKARFYIISKDTGFDPLIQHLAGKDIRIERCARISEVLTNSSKSSLELYVDAAIEDLARRGTARPRREKTLSGTLAARFKDELSRAQIEQLVDLLCKKGIVQKVGQTVTYKLPVPA